LCDLVPGDGESIRKVVEDAFDLTETVLKNQREFANSVLDRILGESTSKQASTARRSPTKRAAKRTAHKSAAKAGAA
jgi:mannitol-1-phosphate/altronate dehydrogenase